MRQSKRSKKIRNLVLVSALCAVVLTVSTYAWFIGMKTVNVSSFDVDIATTEGLFLSMDGQSWSYNLDARNAEAYTGNTNSWADTGLIPVSSIGDMDPSVSRMELYEKASLTTTKGGYRLLASRVDNYTKDGSNVAQGKGYVVFDLFVKNLSGTAYYTDNQPLNEEAIYLTTNSAVTVANNGGTPGTGIENSVRVAFAQIGRVTATEGSVSAVDITGITCANVGNNTDKNYVTGICRQAEIWEPNDTAHVENAINWYNTSCDTRKSSGSDVTSTDSYNVGTSCTTIANGVSYPTYAISRTIGISDNVDIYDGTSFNTYTSNSAETTSFAAYESAYSAAISADSATMGSVETAMASYKLVSYPYFTDTMKNKLGTNRPTFMTLAPNSITKVRVYIYIEGQDIDNYDFASLGKKISVNFGFTKERYIETDIPYTGPSTTITPTGTGTVATTAPTAVPAA